MDNAVIGIDLGTTFSAAAIVDEKGVPQVIPIDDQDTLPSVVLIDGDRTVVGELALNQWVTNEEHVVRKHDKDPRDDLVAGRANEHRQRADHSPRHQGPLRVLARRLPGELRPPRILRRAGGRIRGRGR